MSRRVNAPFFLLSMTHNRRRLAASMAGLVFAVVLMFTQVGFRAALLDSTVELIHKLDADLVILNRMTYSLTARQKFPRRRVSQAASVDGVRDASAMYIETVASLWKRPGDPSARPIRVLGVDPDTDPFEIDSVRTNLDQLRSIDVALFDSKSRREFGRPEAGSHAELAGKSVEVGGVFTLGTDFAHDGTVIVGDRGFWNYFAAMRHPDVGARAVDLGIVRVEPGTDIAHVQRDLRAALEDDVRVMTKDELIAQEMRFWLTQTPIGFIFGLGTAMGFIVGVVICYQVLYADVTSKLKQYATMKAMGFRNAHLVLVVLEASILFALIAFALALVLTLLLNYAAAAFTGLVFRLTVVRALLVFVLTVAMCAIAALLAVRRALATDPAELF